MDNEAYDRLCRQWAEAMAMFPGLEQDLRQRLMACIGIDVEPHVYPYHEGSRAAVMTVLEMVEHGRALERIRADPDPTAG